jgi:hypothetical protein
MSNGKSLPDFTEHAACISPFFTLHFTGTSFLSSHHSFVHKESDMNKWPFSRGCNICIIIGLVRFVTGQTGSNADVPYNHEFQVNPSAQYDQFQPCADYLDHGRFVVCWMVTDKVLNGIGLYGQIFLKNAERWGPEFQVNTSPEFQFVGPQVSRLPDNGFVVCWEGEDPEGHNIICAQCFDSSGFKQGVEFQVNTENHFLVQHAGVSYLADGGFVICWEIVNPYGYDYDIHAQVFDHDGSMRGSEFQVNTTTNFRQELPCVSHLPDGGFVICWQSQGQDGSDFGIFGQIFDSQSEKQGPEFQVNTHSQYLQENACVSSLSDGGFVVCYDSWNHDGNEAGVFGQMFDALGGKAGPEFQVNTYSRHSQGHSSVGRLSDGSFAVCWQSWAQDGWYSGIYGQVFDSSGTRRGGEIQINDYTENDQLQPSVSFAPEGGFIVCWSSWGQDGQGNGIFGKYYTQEINHPLIPFSLLEPADDSLLHNVNPYFRWSQASSIRINFPWELEYHLYLDDDENFSHPNRFHAVCDTVFSLPTILPDTIYYWKVLAKNVGGDSLFSNETGRFISGNGHTTVEMNAIIEQPAFGLCRGFPNPFNTEVTIELDLPPVQGTYHIRIIIFDTLGHRVCTLKDESEIAGGRHSVKWTGKDNSGYDLPSGVYLCQVQTREFSGVQKLMLIR